MSRVRKPLYFLILIFGVLLFIERSQSWLFDPDEARYAEIPQAMLMTGDYLTPKLNGSNYFEKPPLLYWMNAFSMHVLGDTPFAARLPVRLATLGMAFLLFWFLKKPDSVVHLWAVLVFLSSLGPFVLGRINLTDAIVSFGLTLTMLSMREILVFGLENRHLERANIGIWLGAGISFMAKGLIGLVLPLLVLIPWVVIMGQPRKVFKMLSIKGFLLFVAISAPWFILMEKAHPGFLYIIFIREHFLRYLTDEAHRPGSMFYYIPVLVGGALPWSFFFLGSLRNLITLRLEKIRLESDKLFFGIWVFSIFGFFSLSHSKLIPYLLPVFPAVAALIGMSMGDGGANKKRALTWSIGFWTLISIGGMLFIHRIEVIQQYDLEWPIGILLFFTTLSGWVGVWRARINEWEGPLWLVSGWGVCYLVLIFVAPIIAKDYSLHDLAVTANQFNADKIIAFKTFPHSFPLVLKRPIPLVSHQDELATDGVLSKDLFLNDETFFSLWASESKIVVVLRKEALGELQLLPRKPTVLSEIRKYILVGNFSPADPLKAAFPKTDEL